MIFQKIILKKDLIKNTDEKVYMTNQKDTHSADVKAVFEEIQYIHKMIGVE